MTDVPEMGGYLELDLPAFKPSLESGVLFQSGRAALRHLLSARNVKKTFVPSFVCDAVVSAVADAGSTCSFYNIDSNFRPVNVDFRSGDTMVYVNYFGLNDRNVDYVLKTYPADSVVVDNAQALFADQKDCLGAIYSPRKFIGLPDGGVLKSCHVTPTEPVQPDQGTFRRMEHLLIRAADSARAGFNSYQLAERSLSDTTPLAMSSITRRLLESVDVQHVRNARHQNFAVLNSRLGQRNDFAWDPEDAEVPLCYPFKIKGIDAKRLRSGLLRLNIYVPTYWEEARPRLSSDSFEMRLIDNTLFLPVDQRYGPGEMEYLCDRVVELVQS